MKTCNYSPFWRSWHSTASSFVPAYYSVRFTHSSYPTHPCVGLSAGQRPKGHHGPLVSHTKLIQNDEQLIPPSPMVHIVTKTLLVLILVFPFTIRSEKVKPKDPVTFSEELLQREEKLRLRELEIVKKEEQARLVSQELEKKIRDFNKHQKKFILCTEMVKKEENDRVEHMVKVVSGMKASSAAEILSVQDISLAVKIMAGLSPEKISRIFNLMDREISAKLQKKFMIMKK